MFIDQADIQVLAGDGGNGCISFRREKYIPHGGPDGGDGGRGGDVFLEATAGVDTLLDMMGRHHWRATRGMHGMGKKKAGSDGEDLTIRVPPGTLVYDADSKLLIADLKEAGKRVKVAKGGRGGRGNIHFVTSVHQAPEYAEPGRKGQVRNLHLELRLIADVGLVGQPNAGKSTLLSRISAARPKIADYPFTTLVPQLGIAELDAERRLVVADIPGLIEGASTGSGLGLDFLRHIERTRVIVHLLDILPLDGSKPINAYREIRAELKAYSPKLAAKPEVLVVNKMDLSGASEALADLRSELPGKQILAISAVTGTGLRPVLEAIWQQVQKAPPSEPLVEPAQVMAVETGNEMAEDDEPAALQDDPFATPLVEVEGDEDVAEEPATPAKTPRKKGKSARKLVVPGKKLAKPAAAAKGPNVAKPAAKAATKPAGKAAAKAATSPAAKAKPAPEVDAELAAEIAAMKADDARKSKYYRKG